MIKAYKDKKNDRTVVQIKGEETDILVQLHSIIKGVYEELSLAGKKTVIENWDSLYRPDLSEKEAALKSLENFIEKDFSEIIEKYMK